MEKITDLTSLDTQIAMLEQRQENEKAAIESEFHNLMESLKPANLIKSMFRSVKESPDLKSDLLHGAIGLGTGFLTNKLLLGKIHGPIKMILSALLPTVITKAAVQNTDDIKEKGLSLLAKALRSLKIKNGEDVADDQHAKAGAVL